MTENFSDNQKRKAIRSYFLDISKPEEDIDNNGLEKIILFFVFLTIASVPGAIISNPYTDVFGYVAGGSLLIFIFFAAIDAFGGQGAKLRYKEEKKAYEDILKKWDLSEDDINNPPDDSTIDQWLEEDLQKAADIALEKLSLTEEDLVRESLIIYGPLFWSTYGIPDEDVLTYKISNGVVRFGCYRFVIVLLSEDRIATYSANFNFLRYTFTNEETVEYLYRDIVAVSTAEKSTNYDLPNGKTLRRAQVFRLTVPGDSHIEVVVNSPEIKDLLGGEPKVSSHDQSVRVIREMIRDKKS